MIEYLYKSSKDRKVDISEKYKKGSWVYVEDPSEKEILKLKRKFKLDLGLLKDALDPFEVPRTENEENRLYTYIRSTYIDENHVSTTPILIIVSSSFVITITQKPLTIFKNFIEKKTDFETRRCMKLALQLLAEINNSFSSCLLNVNREIYKFSANIEKIQNKDILKFVTYEQISNEFLNRLIQNNNAISRFSCDKKIKLNEENSELVEDLLLNNGQLIENSKNTLTTVKNIKDTYSTILSNNLNRVIKLLTSFTIIINIPTMIAGLWGMNVRVPFANSGHAFLLVIGLIGLVCLFLIYFFNKKDWM